MSSNLQFNHILPPITQCQDVTVVTIPGGYYFYVTLHNTGDTDTFATLTCYYGDPCPTFFSPCSPELITAGATGNCGSDSPTTGRLLIPGNGGQNTFQFAWYPAPVVDCKAGVFFQATDLSIQPPAPVSFFPGVPLNAQHGLPCPEPAIVGVAEDVVPVPPSMPIFFSLKAVNPLETSQKSTVEARLMGEGQLRELEEVERDGFDRALHRRGVLRGRLQSDARCALALGRERAASPPSVGQADNTELIRRGHLGLSDYTRLAHGPATHGSPLQVPLEANEHRQVLLSISPGPRPGESCCVEITHKIPGHPNGSLLLIFRA